MTLDAMNKYLEDHGFTVNRTRDSSRGVYIFHIMKNGRSMRGEYKWPQTEDWRRRDRDQHNFLQNLMREFHGQKWEETNEDEWLGKAWCTDAFANRQEAETALEDAYGRLVKNGKVTIEDFAEFCGRPRAYWMSQRGWRCLDGSCVSRVRDGYVIMLPMPVDLNDPSEDPYGRAKANFKDAYRAYDDALAGLINREVINNKEENEMKDITWKVESYEFHGIDAHSINPSLEVNLTGFINNNRCKSRRVDDLMHDIEDTLNKPSVSYVSYARNDVEITRNIRNRLGVIIKNVIHNDPATIVFWADGTKTVVKCQPGDIYDPEKGLAMAISKKVLGNKGNYYNTFAKWLPKEKSVEIPADTNRPLTKEEVVNLSVDGHKLWVKSTGAFLSNGDGWYGDIHKNWSFSGYGNTWVAYRDMPKED